MLEQLLQKLTPQEVILIALAVISLALDYLPGLKEKFEAASEQTKKTITVIIAVLLTGVFFLGQCLGWFVTNLVCSPYTILDFLYAVVIGVAVMYGFHKATKPLEFKK